MYPEGKKTGVFRKHKQKEGRRRTGDVQRALKKSRRGDDQLLKRGAHEIRLKKGTGEGRLFFGHRRETRYAKGNEHSRSRRGPEGRCPQKKVSWNWSKGGMSSGGSAGSREGNVPTGGACPTSWKRLEIKTRSRGRTAV